MQHLTTYDYKPVLCGVDGPPPVSASRLYPIRSDYPFSHAAHPQPRPQLGLRLSVAWIGPSVDGSINCVEQSYYFLTFLSLFLPTFLVACQWSLEHEAIAAVEAI